MLGSEATVRHPTQGGIHSLAHRRHFRVRCPSNLPPPKRLYTFFQERALSTSPLEANAQRERERERESPPFNPRPLQSPTQTRDRVPKGVESKKLHRMGASRLLPEAILTLCRSRANEPPS